MIDDSAPWDEPAKTKRADGPIFERLGEGYRLDYPTAGICLELDFVRREKHQLIGELSVKCDLPGALTLDGIVSVAELNLSSVRARQERARYLSGRARTGNDVDWVGLLEELSQRVLASERAGLPDVLLSDLPASGPIELLDIEGLVLPAKHPSVIFGDGDSAKSYFVLYVLGRLAQKGLKTGLADWELNEHDHADRLRRLFPGSIPPVRYLRCARPITHEADRLRRWVQDRELDYIGCDSVAYASAGPPENSDVAMAYFQSIRRLGPIGSAHVAHIVKNSEGSDRRPFGSTFWHNSPRATWFVKLSERDPGSLATTLALYPRKFNLGPLPAAVAFELTFEKDRTSVRRRNVQDVPDLAAGLSVRQRMAVALQHGSLPTLALAEQIEADPETVRRTARRYKDQFLVLDGGALGLVVHS